MIEYFAWKVLEIYIRTYRLNIHIFVCFDVDFLFFELKPRTTLFFLSLSLSPPAAALNFLFFNFVFYDHYRHRCCR